MMLTFDGEGSVDIRFFKGARKSREKKPLRMKADEERASSERRLF